MVTRRRQNSCPPFSKQKEAMSLYHVGAEPGTNFTAAWCGRSPS
ncbi:hypothetical protein SNOG_10067 [Parastagonospora nodorum SN15]|uniref:Uncharacterized protein n=1 Tax=Phaeosphaeria nodorum (strain SN15 / ATCC MYA-4574 / FGSC 10173) TaxID=321614 RepID=Q0UDU7_PHANO|nr:hypothetical protein SNOG_10067 [Parastagonospora nodorum SN15]EAT82402.1 hypothetical protein SNOG_10067 [Parastagonospora nodorum SN15]